MASVREQMLNPAYTGNDGRSLRDGYLAAEPFPHVVLEDVLTPGVLRRAIDEFPRPDGPEWTNYVHVNERKHGNTRAETWGPTLREVADALMAPDFVRFLEGMTGIDGLLPDPELDGGGLHSSITGGFLNVHADFTVHHTQPGWERRVNIILFLNDDWQEEWGGALELWERDMSRCVQTVAPVGNRAVVFTTTTDSYHGHPTPLACPADRARQSLALYYFTAGSTAKARTTDYRGRPQDSRLRRGAIWLDQRALRVYDVAKRRLGLSDATVSRWLGRFGRKGGGPA